MAVGRPHSDRKGSSVNNDQAEWEIDGRRSPPTPMRLYLVRHGTTTMNVENRYRGQGQYPLDRQGYFDAVNAGVQLIDKRVVAIHCGPLERTQDTAYVIGQIIGLGGDNRQVGEGFINLDYGDWEGLTPTECAERDPALYRAYRTDPDVAYCPRGERLRDAADRFIDALGHLRSRYAERSLPLAVVTHGVMIRLALTRLIGPERWLHKSVGTGGIAALDSVGGRWELVEAQGILPSVRPAPLDLVPVGASRSAI
jgi:broad specificity phosphatase PhoE